MARFGETKNLAKARFALRFLFSFFEVLNWFVVGVPTRAPVWNSPHSTGRSATDGTTNPDAPFGFVTGPHKAGCDLLTFAASIASDVAKATHLRSLLPS